MKAIENIGFFFPFFFFFGYLKRSSTAGSTLSFDSYLNRIHVVRGGKLASGIEKVSLTLVDLGLS